MDFANTYVALGERFYQRSEPTPVSSPTLLLWNTRLAEQLSLRQKPASDAEALAAIFSGNTLPKGAEPIASAYAGHQFGNFNPQLGDGRAHLLGELLDDQGCRWDLQLKGSGRSAFSRNGDGRCAIGPAVREFIMSEAMQALGVPTTQCLAVVTTGESVYRKTAEPGAVVTRVASSHIRLGTFQYFAARGDRESLTKLADYTIDRHYPEVRELAGNDHVLLLDKVIEKQITLVVAWMRVGFIHGVMNTDNTAICGDTIDFGPCAMMGVYDPQTVYSSIDTSGRYAFGSQPDIAHWNMVRFAECILALYEQGDEAIFQQVEPLISDFPRRFQQQYMAMMAAKFGMAIAEPDDDKLIRSLLDSFSQRQVDYTIGFDRLTESLQSEAAADQAAELLGSAFPAWRQRLARQATTDDEVYVLMRGQNPRLIPRNHLMEQVLQSCTESGQATAAEPFLEALRSPYEETPQTAKYQSVDEDFDRGYRTFCGT
ncbi:uncharacterized protein YdiU (UPF0061 family) [Sinobacterium caligoides]|uniref:Protein nucleotidyltransferase YdiU n=1 Tax=Sinobacterium caligoides TaxID=933926 RepID=A0A3N2DPQ5_9GAMM|nr:YdiU family protein [Sinobacterium caligoides]ROS01791.1 uncharacterized protein YdiU (UPF0061 family) [Sinobacterium caligoides]